MTRRRAVKYHRAKKWNRHQALEQALATAVRTADGCLLATRGITDRGYVRLSAESRQWLAHRLVMEFALGRPLSADEVVDHTCHNDSGCSGGVTCLHRRCLEASHHEVTDAVTNWRRGRGPEQLALGPTARWGQQ